MNVMNDNQYFPEGRFGELLLLLPILQRISLFLVARIGGIITASTSTANINTPAKNLGTEEVVNSLRLDDLLSDILFSGK